MNKSSLLLYMAMVIIMMILAGHEGVNNIHKEYLHESFKGTEETGR